jgi:hypothetical protein
VPRSWAEKAAEGAALSRRRLAVVAAGALVLPLGLAACSSSPAPKASSSSTTSPTVGSAQHGQNSPSTTTVHRGTTTTPTTAVPVSVPNQDNIRRDVTMSSCKAVPDGWSASGTVTNSFGKQATYTITVFFTSAQATDLSFGVTNVVLLKGEKLPWTVRQKFAVPAGGALCVLRGVSAK